MTTLARRRERPLVGWPEWFGRFFPEWAEDMGELRTIKVEEYREDGTAVIRAELPGIDPDKDVEITVEQGTLTIRAERRRESKVEEKDRYRSEFEYGSFVRTLPLPPGATEEDVKATYKDGVLEVRVPVAQAAADTKKIPITRV